MVSLLHFCLRYFPVFKLYLIEEWRFFILYFNALYQSEFFIYVSRQFIQKYTLLTQSYQLWNMDLFNLLRVRYMPIN